MGVIGLTWSYVAGFFDGEGCISTHQNRARRAFHGTDCSFAQSGDIGKEVLTDIQQFLLSHQIKSYITMQTFGRYRPGYSLKILARPSVMVFLKAIIPYLRVKRIIAEDTYRFLLLYPPLRGFPYAMRLTPGWYGRRQMRTPRTDARRELVVKALDAGLSPKQIAEQIGVTLKVVKHDLHFLRTGSRYYGKELAARRARNAA